MQPSFTKKLGFCICKIKITAQKIDGSRLKTYNMVIALSHIDNKDKKFCFFKQTLFLANNSMDDGFE